MCAAYLSCRMCITVIVPSRCMKSRKHKRCMYSKTFVKQLLSKRQAIDFQDRLLLNARQKYSRMLQREHSAILLTLIKLPFVIKICVLYIFEWPFYTGFTVFKSSIWGGISNEIPPQMKKNEYCSPRSNALLQFHLKLEY